MIEQLPSLGVEAQVVHPGDFRRAPMPGYQEIQLSLNPWKLKQIISDACADAVHIVTEGPLGIFARRYCTASGIPFTTSVHTKFPEYVAERLPVSPDAGYAFLRWFHGKSSRVLAMSPSHRDELASQGLRNLRVWLGGVDTERFQPRARVPRRRPRLIFVGRVAVEKNLEAFLRLSVDGEKVVVGDGPQREALQEQYPDATWLGYRHGDALVKEMANADVLVFPSRTDTYGLVMLEANACGTPVAAFPVTGPRDIVTEGVNGCLHNNLAIAIQGALQVDRTRCRDVALSRSWQATAQSLIDSLAVDGVSVDLPHGQTIAVDEAA